MPMPGSSPGHWDNCPQRMHAGVRHHAFAGTKCALSKASNDHGRQFFPWPSSSGPRTGMDIL
eukprot:7170541-Alexandrium_andersonii.AAC.1